LVRSVIRGFIKDLNSCRKLGIRLLMSGAAGGGGLVRILA